MNKAYWQEKAETFTKLAQLELKDPECHFGKAEEYLRGAIEAIEKMRKATS